MYWGQFFLFKSKNQCRITTNAELPMAAISPYPSAEGRGLFCGDESVDRLCLRICDQLAKVLDAELGEGDASLTLFAGAEGVPAFEHVVHGLGGIGMAGELRAFGTHPGFEIGDERSDVLFAVSKPFFGGSAADGALMNEDGIDLLHRFERDRRDDDGFSLH